MTEFKVTRAMLDALAKYPRTPDDDDDYDCSELVGIDKVSEVNKKKDTAQDVDAPIENKLGDS